PTRLPSTPLPYTTLFRSYRTTERADRRADLVAALRQPRAQLDAQQCRGRGRDTTAEQRGEDAGGHRDHRHGLRLGGFEVPDVERSEEHTSELQSRFELVC